MAQELPVPGLKTEYIELLGQRPIDIVADWPSYIGAYPDLLMEGRDYWKRQMELFAGEGDIHVSDSIFDRLNAEQRQVFDMFIRYYEDTLDENV